MKRFFCLSFSLLIFLSFLSLTSLGAVNYTWTGATSTAWSVSTNWSPGGVPTSADNVTIVNTANKPVLGASVTVSSFTMTGGALDLGTFTFTCLGHVTCSGGTISNGSFIVNASAGTTTLASTTFNVNVNVTSYRVLLNGCVYNGSVFFDKVGSYSDDGSGGNIFNSTVDLKNSGPGILKTGCVSPDIFQQDLKIDITNGAGIYLAYNSSGNQFNGNIVLTNTAGWGGVFFGEGTSASATLAAGKKISIDSAGFTTATLSVKRFTQIGATPQALNITGGGYLKLGPSAVFNGNVTFVSSRLLLNGAAFNGTAYLEKNGSGTDISDGGNIFNGNTELKMSVPNQLNMGEKSPDIFNGDFTITALSGGSFYLCNNSANNQFNGNIFLNVTTTYAGINFCAGSLASATLASGKNISAGSSGFSTGELRIYRFTQLGAASQSLMLTGSAKLSILTGTVFNGKATFTAPSLWLNGAIFNDSSTFNKTGTTPDGNNRECTFNAPVTFSLTNGTLNLSEGGVNIYNSDVTFTNTGPGIINAVSNSSATTLFNGNIIINNTGGGNISFSYPGGTGIANLADSKTISVGSLGFSTGGLVLLCQDNYWKIR